MRNLILAVAAVFVVGNAAWAGETPIRVDFRLAQGTDLLHVPSVTAKPGVPVKIEVTQPVASPGGLVLDTGVSLKGASAWKDGKIAYDFLLRIREANEKGGGDPGVLAFRTREFLLHGTAEPGRDAEVKCGDGVVAILRLSPGKA